MRKKSMVNRQWSIVNACLPTRQGQRSIVRSLKQIFLLLTFHFSLLTVVAQSISASLDRDKILLGEQVTLKLNLTDLNTSTSFIAGWPQLQDTLDHLEILKRTHIDTIEVNRNTSYQQSFTLTGFDSGRWQLGPFDFMIQDKTWGKQIKISSPAVYLTVLPVNVSSLKDYHPLKDIIEVETVFNWLPVIIGVAIIIAAAIILIIIKKRKKKIVPVLKPVVHGTALERAIEKLQHLKDQTINNDAAIKKFHSDVDIICRQYFEETTQVKAMQATASELFSRMNVYMQDANLRAKVRDIFELNASVKFAKYMPPETESKSILGDVIVSLQKIDALAQQAKGNADKMVTKY